MKKERQAEAWRLNESAPPVSVVHVTHPHSIMVKSMCSGAKVLASNGE